MPRLFESQGTDDEYILYLEKLVCTLNTQATKSNRKNSRDRSQPSYPIPSLLIEKESSKAKQKLWLLIR